MTAALLLHAESPKQLIASLHPTSSLGVAQTVTVESVLGETITGAARTHTPVHQWMPGLRTTLPTHPGLPHGAKAMALCHCFCLWGIMK